MDWRTPILWAAAEEVNEAANLAFATGQLNTAEDLKMEAIRILGRISYGVSDTGQHNSGTENDS
jgi:hypothetical protein